MNNLYVEIVKDDNGNLMEGDYVILRDDEVEKTKYKNFYGYANGEVGVLRKVEIKCKK